MFRRMLNRSDSINSVAPFSVVILRLAAFVALAIAAAAPSRLAAQPSSVSATDFVRGVAARARAATPRTKSVALTLLGCAASRDGAAAAIASATKAASRRITTEKGATLLMLSDLFSMRRNIHPGYRPVHRESTD